MMQPTVYRITLPLYTDWRKRELVHPKIVKDSPCGWCGKKSTMRIRHYENDELTKALVTATCKRHSKNFHEFVREIMEK